MKTIYSTIVGGAALVCTALFANCQTSELSLHWPLSGVDGVDWVINNYVDLDSGPGLKDYKGNMGNAAKTYNGHQGIDIDLPNFRYMDAMTIARAAAPGTVTEVQANLFDRNMHNPGNCAQWNHVAVKHANGFTTFYGHLMQDGLLVKVGDNVAEGQALGYVGSSGCSTVTHLHFETHDCNGNAVDPFLNNMVYSAPAYDTTFKLMDMSVRKGGFPESPADNDDTLMKDPSHNIATIGAGGRIGIGLSVAGGSSGDVLDVLIRKPDNSVYVQFSPLTYTTAGRHSWPRWWTSLPTSGDFSSDWTVEVRLNHNLVRTHHFAIIANQDAVVQGAYSQTYQQNFNSLTNDTYHPVSVSGATGPHDGPLLSAVFTRGSEGFIAVHNRDGAQFQSDFNNATSHGLQLLDISNYTADGKVLIAAIFGPPTGGHWKAYHLVSQAVHQANFNSFATQHYHPYAITVANLNGVDYYSAVYNDLPTNGYVARNGFTPEDYQTEFNNQKAAGRGLLYLSAYEVNGTPRFSAIWTAEANQGTYAAMHGLTEQNFFNENESKARLGYHATHITSYMGAGKRLYAGIWRR